MSRKDSSAKGRRRVCLIGCGRIARVHAGNLKGQVDLCYCSRSAASARSMYDRYGGFAVYDDLAAVADAPVDAAVVCTPPELHLEQTIRLLQAGKSVLVEKPMCASPAELQEIEAARAASTEGVLMVAENYYYKPSLNLIRRLLATGRLGGVREVALRKVTGQEAQGWKAGHGALLEGGIHFVALLSGILDEAPEQVTAEFPGRRPGAPERHAVLELTYSGGVHASLTYAWDTPSLTKGTFQHSRIVCERGQLVFESNGLYLLVKAGIRSRLYGPDLGDLMGYRAMARDFVACLEDPARQPLSDLRKASRDLRIVFDAYRYLPA